MQEGTTLSFGLAVKRSGSLAFYFQPVPPHCQFLLKHHTIQAQQPFQGLYLLVSKDSRITMHLLFFIVPLWLGLLELSVSEVLFDVEACMFGAEKLPELANSSDRRHSICGEQYD